MGSLSQIVDLLAQFAHGIQRNLFLIVWIAFISRFFLCIRLIFLVFDVFYRDELGFIGKKVSGSLETRGAPTN